MLIVRNMVCDRCKAVVRRVLTEQGMPVVHLELGEVELEREPSPAQLDRAREALKAEGFELVDGREAAMIARIKAAIVKLVHHNGEAQGRVKLSEHLSAALNKEYSSLTTLFSQVEGITIEQYFLLQRLERVKELIKYDELTLSEIADRTGFSSVAHLSAQFKKLTGMTPSAFKAMGMGERRSTTWDIDADRSHEDVTPNDAGDGTFASSNNKTIDAMKTPIAAEKAKANCSNTSCICTTCTCGITCPGEGCDCGCAAK